jgi:hypothetical protein
MTAAIGYDEADTMDGSALGWVVMATHDHTPRIVQKSGGGGTRLTSSQFVSLSLWLSRSPMKGASIP